MSSEITSFRSPTSWTGREGNISMDDNTRVDAETGGVEEPGMCGHSTHGNRETSGGSRGGNDPAVAGNPEKVERRTAGGNTPEESDNIVVVEDTELNQLTGPT